jgi:hypothetical protein
MHLIVLLGDVAQAEANFGLFRDRFNFDANKGASFAPNVPHALKSL